MVVVVVASVVVVVVDGAEVVVVVATVVLLVVDGAVVVVVVASVVLVVVVVVVVVLVVALDTVTPATFFRSQLHFDPVSGMASATELQAPDPELRQLVHVPMSRMPSPSVSVQGTVIRTTSLYVNTPCSISPHASPSTVAYGPVPLVGLPELFSVSGGIRASCSQAPLWASPASIARKKPTSYRRFAPAETCMVRSSVAVSPANVQPAIKPPGRSASVVILTSFVVQPLAPARSSRHV